MPARKQPARLWLRPAREGRRATWLIIHERRHHSTGCGESDIEGAQEKLEAFLAKLRRREERPTSTPSDKVFISDVVIRYLEAKKQSVARRRELVSRCERLIEWWGDKPLSSVTRHNCMAYAVAQKSQSLARRELEDLRAAINMAIQDGYCREKVIVTLPEKPKSRDRFLTRSEAARLLWTAYSFKEEQKGVVTEKRPSRHVARFILTALYTASRSARVWRASFDRIEGHPWVDLERGLFFREAPGERAADNKRAPPIRLPDRLLAHMRRWRKNGAKYVVEYRGKPADPKKSYRNTVVRSGLDEKVIRHTLRHTAVTWLMQASVDKWEVSGFAGMSLQTIERTYGHHHPEHQKGVGNAFSSGAAGRRRD